MKIFRQFVLFTSIIISSLIPENPAQAQVTIIGNILSDDKNAPIENAAIQIQNTHIGTVSDKSGKFDLKVPFHKQYTLVFSHINYQTKYRTVTCQHPTDTIKINIRLLSKQTTLKPVEITAESKPVTVFKSTKINVADFQFFEDKFLMITYSKNLNKNSELVLTDANEKIIDKHFIPGKPTELYTNYIGQNFLICNNKAYFINIINNNIFLEPFSKDDIDLYIKPIVDKINHHIIFSDFIEQYPNFKYYLFNKIDSNYYPLKEITDELLDNQYHMEYYKLSNADKQYAKRLAKKLKGLDKFDVAAALTGYANDFLFEPLYAPLFVLNDTINLFDFHSDTLYRYVRDSVLISAVPISFHHPKKWKEWKKKMIIDHEQAKIYALFLHNGHYVLKQIDLKTGNITYEKQLTHKYVEHLKLKNGFAYYTYKPY